MTGNVKDECALNETNKGVKINTQIAVKCQMVMTRLLKKSIVFTVLVEVQRSLACVVFKIFINVSGFKFLVRQ